MTAVALTVMTVLALLWPVFIYNRLVTLRNDVKNAWHQIDIQLKRRHDLIPNLVAVVKGYMEFERDTLERVTAARARAVSAVHPRDRALAEERLTEALSGLFIVVERYPVLKSNENVMGLQEELTSTENRIAFARQHYNDLVATFKSRIEVFPDTVVAGLFAFRSPDYFSADPDDRKLPSADMGLRPK